MVYPPQICLLIFAESLKNARNMTARSTTELIPRRDERNAFVVGYENGIPKHAHKRGTYGESSFKGNLDADALPMQRASGQIKLPLALSVVNSLTSKCDIKNHHQRKSKSYPDGSNITVLTRLCFGNKLLNNT